MTLAAAIFYSLATPAAQAADAEPYQPDHREYRLVYAPVTDLRTMSTASVTLNRMSQDVYNYGIGPSMPKGVNAVFGTAWAMFFTYTTMLWSHEFGHWARAQQVDSRFVFKNAMPLLPHTIVEMPDDATDADRALLSVGGFEVNGLVARQVQLDFYEHGGAWSDELGHALLSEAFFPIYASIFPAEAKAPNTWIETRGDPVHVVLPVFERATGRPPITASGEVDRALVNQYRETVLLSFAWTLLDPGTVQQAMAFGDDRFGARRAWMPVRTERFGWTWGTQFNPSPLGYELYLLNYVVLDERLFEVAVKHGRPMKNNGIRIAAPDLFETDRIRLGAEIELWDQAVYGLGASGAASAAWQFDNGIGLVGELGYKSEGYVMGRAIDATPVGSLGLSYRFAHVAR